MTNDLSFDDQGSGIPLILMHGFPLDRRIFSLAAPLLARSFRVITLDLPGFGQSKNDQPFTMDSMADHIRAFWKSHGIEKPILGGLSMGGYVAQALAGRYGDELRGLMLINTKASADTAEAKKAREEMATLAREKGAVPVADQMFPKMITTKTIAEKPTIATLVRDIMSRCPPLTIKHACLAMRDRSDYTAQLAAYAFPTLIVTGSEDPIASPAIAEQMDRPLRYGGLSIIPDAAHLSPLEQPEKFAEAVHSFFLPTHRAE